MKTTIFSVFLFLVSVFTLSSCTIKDQLKTKILDKVETKVTKERLEDQTDEQLLKQLNTDDTSIDADLNSLNTELQ